MELQGRFYQMIEKLKPAVEKNKDCSYLHWVKKTCCPEAGKEDISRRLSQAAKEAHELFITDEIGDLIGALAQVAEGLSPNQGLVVNRLALSYRRAKALSSEFVKHKTDITSTANNVWEKARRDNDFALFAPHLEKVIEVTREEAGFYGAESGDARSAYSFLFEGYEPGMALERLEEIMQTVREWLVPFFAKIRAASHQPSDEMLHGGFDEHKQELLSNAVARTIGFDFKRGVLGKTEHPFSMGISLDHCSIGNRYNPSYVGASLFAGSHEVGHGDFSQGIDELIDSISVFPLVYSLGIHESQSRLWENMVGRGKPFWQHFYPILCTVFPQYWDISRDKFYEAINVSKPSPIRIHADEVSYNLHILLRFELELAMLSGELEAEALPAEFDRLMREYVGYESKNMQEGVLQDVHWSDGLIGYFPTYLLGNLAMAQLFATYAADVSLSTCEDQFSRGNFGGLLGWLREKVHPFGLVKTLDGLLKEVTGEPLNPQYWFNHIEQKFGELYKL